MKTLYMCITLVEIPIGKIPVESNWFQLVPIGKGNWLISNWTQLFSQWFNWTHWKQIPGGIIFFPLQTNENNSRVNFIHIFNCKLFGILLDAALSEIGTSI